MKLGRFAGASAASGARPTNIDSDMRMSGNIVLMRSSTFPEPFCWNVLSLCNHNLAGSKIGNPVGRAALPGWGDERRPGPVAL